MSIIEINGVGLPAPSSVKLSSSDMNVIDENELGEEQIDNIRNRIDRASLAFAELNNSQHHLILSALDTLVLNVKFPTSSGFQIKKMRLNGDINSEMTKGRDGKAYWNTSFSLKEI